LTKEKIERSEAILRKKRNTRKGLQKRNQILIFLNSNTNYFFTTSEIMDGTGTNYASVVYHLRNMHDEDIVEKTTINRRVKWKITGLGQQTIKRWLENNS